MNLFSMYKISKQVLSKKRVLSKNVKGTKIFLIKKKKEGRKGLRHIKIFLKKKEH